MIIADTNLIVYLFVQGIETELAKKCGLRDPFWQAPAIWRHEFINALSQHMRLRGLPIDKALGALALADELIQTVTLHGLDERILQTGFNQKIASYDAQFLVAAEFADVPLVTADRILLERSGGRAISIVDFAAGK